jgi:cyclomaltodextrinase
VGRDFWAFKDVQARGDRSPYARWFAGLSFAGRSPYGDSFTYEGWSGHHSLVKLELKNPAVREHLFSAVDAWVRDFGIDGLRMDAADVMDLGFLSALASHCRLIKPDFWLMGEVVHGDYSQWVNPTTLDSVTNYECYKGLYSSFNDKNLFEIGYSLKRQFARGGIYEGKLLYSFVDNHDVNRLSSTLKNPAHLHPLYCLLFSMPGIPSVYYGSEWGIEGRKNGSDWPLRPRLELEAAPKTAPHPDLEPTIRTLARIRRSSPALMIGDYVQLHVAGEQLAFARRAKGESVVAAVNAGAGPIGAHLSAPWMAGGRLVDLLNPGEEFPLSGGKAEVTVPPRWARIMEMRP